MAVALSEQKALEVALVAELQMPAVVSVATKSQHSGFLLEADKHFLCFKLA